MTKISAKELLVLLDNQWASTNDIKVIGAVGTKTALGIMRTLRKEAKNEGYFLPRNLVPMEKVIEYFKLNINYLKKVSVLK